MSSRMIHQQKQLALIAVVTIFAALFLATNNDSIHVVSAFTASTSTSSSLSPATTTTRISSVLSMSSSMAAPSATTTRAMLPEGLVKTIVDRGDTRSTPIARGDVVTVKYTCYTAGDDDDDRGDNNVLLARSDSQKGVVGDGSMVPGWDAAIRSMNIGERAIVRVTDPKLGYGSRGNDDDDEERGENSSMATALRVLGVSKETQLEFDIQIVKVQTAKQAAELFDMNFDAMALADDTPKTAEDIAAAYMTRMEQKEPEKEGLEGWIETVKNYYFFGFFEGETGEEAPWYLTPSITFPVAFAIVGAAFYISLYVGAISEKGQQSIDELDIIVTSFVLPAIQSLQM